MITTDQASGAGVAPYTRTGDDGTTTLGDLNRVSKTDSRIAAYAACEAANAAVGVAISAGTMLPHSVLAVLDRIQHDLIEVQGDLGTPNAGSDDSQLRLDDSYVRRVEEACDHFNEDLPVVDTVVLPRGTDPAAQLYQARTLVRHAELETWHALQEHKDMNAVVGRYLNRLSDLLFVLGRLSNTEHGDSVWQPGMTTREGLLPRAAEAGEEGSE